MTSEFEYWEVSNKNIVMRLGSYLYKFNRFGVKVKFAVFTGLNSDIIINDQFMVSHD